MMNQETYTVSELWLSLPGDSEVGDPSITTSMQLPGEIEVTLLQLHTICNLVCKSLAPFLGSDLTVTAQPIETANAQFEKLIDDNRIFESEIAWVDDYDHVGDDFAFDSARERLLRL